MSESPPELRLDPLYTIFEKHLYDFSEETDNQDEFIAKIVKEYLHFLKERGVVIPRKWSMSIIEELHNQVHSMLVKKTYGCLSIGEFLRREPDHASKRKSAKKKYSRIF